MSARRRDEFKRSRRSLRDYLAFRSGRFMEVPGTEVRLTLNRDHSGNATFSAEALDGVCSQLRSYVWSRVWRAYKASGWTEPPKHMVVHVKVELGTEALPEEPGADDYMRYGR